MVDLQQLKQLVAIAEAGSLSAAAEALHLSQPALSRSMQRLEAELGLTLFEHGKNRVELRELGLRAVEGARLLLHQAQLFTEDLHDYAERLSIVRIGASAPSPMWRLSMLIHERFPKLVVAEELQEADELLSGLHEGRYRLILTHVRPAQKGVLCKKFLEERLVLELPPEHPLCVKTSIEEQDLNDLTVLAYRYIGAWRERLNQMRGLHRIEQTELDVLADLALSSGLPLLTSSLRSSPTAGYGGRVSLPIFVDDAVLPFYLCALESSRALFEQI